MFDNGSIYSPEVRSHFLEGVCYVARGCLAGRLPDCGTSAPFYHQQEVLALSVETDYTFPFAKKAKAFVANPPAFVAAAPVAVTTTAAPAAAPAKVEAKDDSEELDEDMGFGFSD